MPGRFRFPPLAPVLLLILLAPAAPQAAEPARELDAASKEALQRTMGLLTTPGARSEAMKEHDVTRYLDGSVQALGGDAQNADAIYALSAEIFSDLVHQTGGDGARMIEALERAKRDPAAFAESLSPKVRARLKEIGARAPQSAKTPAP
jgi:hypothetical protein